MNIVLLIVLIVLGCLIIFYFLSGYIIYRLMFVGKPKTLMSEEDKLRPKWSEEVGYQTIETLSEDNIILRARYIKHKNAKRIFIMFHGYTGGMDKDFGEIARNVYKTFDADIILVSERAHEISESNLVTFGFNECKDVVSWSSYVNKNISSTLPIYLWGLSMGTHSTLCSLKYKHPDNVKGVIADCGYTRGDLVIKKVTRDDFHLPALTFAWVINIFCKMHGFSLYQNDTRKILNDVEMPILFVHGDNDKVVPFTMSEDNYYAKKVGYKDLLIVKEAGHTQAFHIDQESYIAAIQKLFIHI